MFCTKLKKPCSFSKVPDGPHTQFPNVLRVQKARTQISVIYLELRDVPPLPPSREASCAKCHSVQRSANVALLASRSNLSAFWQEPQRIPCYAGMCRTVPQDSNCSTFVFMVKQLASLHCWTFKVKTTICISNLSPSETSTHFPIRQHRCENLRVRCGCRTWWHLQVVVNCDCQL